MKRVCQCNKVFGYKKPYMDMSRSHGLCEDCFVDQMQKIYRSKGIDPNLDEIHALYRALNGNQSYFVETIIKLSCDLFSVFLGGVRAIKHL